MNPLFFLGHLSFACILYFKLENTELLRSMAETYSKIDSPVASVFTLFQNHRTHDVKSAAKKLNCFTCLLAIFLTLTLHYLSIKVLSYVYLKVCKKAQAKREANPKDNTAKDEIQSPPSIGLYHHPYPYSIHTSPTPHLDQSTRVKGDFYNGCTIVHQKEGSPDKRWPEKFTDPVWCENLSNKVKKLKEELD